MNAGETLAFPVQQIISKLLCDRTITQHQLFDPLFGHQDESEKIKMLTEIFDLWLTDILSVPLEQAIFDKYPKTDELLEYFKTRGYTHEAAVDVVDLLTTNAHMSTINKRLEEPLINHFNLWVIDKTDRCTYLTLKGDYRINFFDKHIHRVTVEQHLSAMLEV